MNELSMENMRKRITIKVSSEVMSEIDRRTEGSHISRSRFIEGVLRDYFKAKLREEISVRDLELINANVDYLIREAADVDRYQAPIDFSSEES
jgi:hypothetical protein